MIKNTFMALFAAIAMAGVAAPAFAGNEGAVESEDFNGELMDESARQIAEQLIILQLRAKGIYATAVEDWGPYVRVYVIEEDGRQVMRLFEPVSLQLVRL